MALQLQSVALALLENEIQKYSGIILVCTGNKYE
jgi:hypothetical protein